MQLTLQTLLSILAISIALLLALSMLLYQFLTGVPTMSASSAEVADIIALLQQSNLKPDAIIYDLGSGWGAIVIALAAAFPHAQIRGIELSPFPYWVARFRTRRLPNVLLLRRNIFKCNLHDADALTCYLMIRVMPKLATLLDSTLKPHTPVVALTFWFRNRQPTATRNGPGLRGAAALYHWPATKPSL